MSSPRDNDAFEQMREKAESLRREVAEFEQRKKNLADKEKRRLEQAKEEEQALRTRYSAVVPILKPDGSTQEERCDFQPRQKDGSTYIAVFQARLPLGIILGESDDWPGAIVVDEVAVGSNGESGGLKVGDIVHACTACKMEMEMPTWQLLAGGIGVPKTKRFMYQADRRPFEEVMEAVKSNRQDPEERPALFVVERKE
ncbi:hypothetical protein ACA910_003185 [Epithemia clementina (nom. ined.)]